MVKSFKKNISGNMAIIFSLALVPLLAGIGAAVDLVNFNRVETTLQAAADAAALAGGTSKLMNNPAVLNKIIKDYIGANHGKDFLMAEPVITQGVDAQSGAFRVTVSGKIKTNFMNLVGIPTMEAAATSVVNLGIQGMEVALVLDNTGSMMGSKLSSLKTAAKQLISTLELAKSDFADLKFGLVPFSKYVNVGKNNAAASWIKGSSMPAKWTGCVGSRKAPLDEAVGADSSGGKIPSVDDSVCPAPIVPLTDDIALLNTQIDAMVATGNTYIATGVLWGWNVLDSSVPFTEGKTAAQLKAINGRKIMVVMTDGTNTASPLYPSHDGIDSALADTKLATLCSNVKGQDIEVYTVLFQVPSLGIKNLLRACASSPDKFYDTESGASLVEAFDGIAKELAEVRLVQ